MNLIKKFNQTIGFTQTEGRVVLFLVGTFLLGYGIRMFRSDHPTQDPSQYAASDSEFAARSALMDKDDSLDAASIVSSQPTYPRTRNGNSASNLALASVDINTASKDELIKLPGIGEAMAERIIIYREENGPFRKLDDLTEVKGIGKKKFERLAPYCTVGK